MKSVFLISLLLGLWLISVDSYAQPRELISAVKGTQLADIRSRNNYFLQKHTYFAKRHRIVEVNGELLESDEKFVIPLFGNDSLIVQVLRRDTDDNGSILYWSGTVIEPVIPASDLVSQGMSPEQAELAHANLFGISISAVRFKHEDVTGESYRVSAPSVHAGRPESDVNQSGPDSNVYYEVATEFIAAKLGVEYRLASLEMDRRYHVLVEVDDAKRVTEGPFDDPEYPEEGRKRRQYKEFVDSLGPDPRKPEATVGESE